MLVEPAWRPRFEWRTAQYPEWNLLLLERCLSRSLNGAVVSQVAATPEELRDAVADEDAEPEEVTTAFVGTVRAQLPSGLSFCGFCRGGGWSPEADDAPHFFGMLWFTCLLAGGYPDGEGSFQSKFRTFVGKSDSRFDCLNDLWADLAKWCESRARYSKLLVPPLDSWRTVIGRSYYLAFPIRPDRKVLEDTLDEAGLSGIEPPIVPLIAALNGARDRFTSAFQEDFDNFLEDIKAGKDPTDGAFWRAIRSAAVGGPGASESERPKSREVTLLATWGDDETLQLRLAVPAGVEIPRTKAHPLSIPLGATAFSLTDESDSVDAVATALLRGEIQLPPGGLGSLVRQGVLVFGDGATGDHWLAWGEECDGAELALVRSDRAEAFQRAFGGTVDESRFAGWCEMSRCKVRQLPRLPDDLEGVSQLLYTTKPPRPSLVGGVRIDGGYLLNKAFMPRIRSPSAIDVSGSITGKPFSCERSGEPDGDWVLPSGLRISTPASIEIQATYNVAFDGFSLQRQCKTTIEFREHGSGCEYKPVGAGDYWRESGRPAQVTHRGGNAVSLDIGTSSIESSGEMLEWEPSRRYLGPGLGEMSLTPKANHAWLALGSRKDPHDVIFIGDLSAPVLPDGGQSTDKGDRRSWAYAFGSSETRVSARVNGRYVPLAEDSRIKQVLGAYRTRSQRRDVEVTRTTAPANIEACWDGESTGDWRAGASMDAVEVLAALGRSRSGIAMREFQQVLHATVGREDHLLCQQLVRAWEEAGLIDVVRRQDRSQTVVVPRHPRLVLVRRGPGVEARLVGLAPKSVTDAIKAMVGRERVSWKRASSNFQPPLLRLAGVSEAEAHRVSEKVGLQEAEWLWWPDGSTLPEHFTVTEDLTGLTSGPPPASYEFDALWDWRDSMFRTRPAEEGSDLVSVERRRHRERCSIYVILVDGDPMLWCHMRTWALLRAAELWERPAFEATPDGWLWSRGRSPIHLPLPFARLCTVLGTALPGPSLGTGGEAIGYRYPFGPGLVTAVRRGMPLTWIRDMGGN